MHDEATVLRSPVRRAALHAAGRHHSCDRGRYEDAALAWSGIDCYTRCMGRPSQGERLLGEANSSQWGFANGTMVRMRLGRASG
jgi:hypothetical protein